jgi:hypothetical protein
MTATRVTALVLGGALLTSWLVVAGTDRQVPPAPLPAVAPSALPDALDAETARLRTLLDHTPAPRAAGRNPFAFATSRRADARRVTAAVATLALDAPAAPAPPAIHLIAIATDGDTRTAALSVGGVVLLARVGDAVSDRYRVTVVSADVVELTDRFGGPPLRLGLR